MSAEPDQHPEGAAAPADEVATADFGPGGYLPPRAAMRARKIVLREQMGLHWPIAAVVAGVLIVLVTLPFVLGQGNPPGSPSVEVGPLEQIDPAGDGLVDAAGTPVLVVRAGGVLRAFVDPPADARWCPASRRIESPDGRIWTAGGRLIAGDGTSLDLGQAQAHEGLLYVDPTPVAGPEPVSGDAEPGCS